jgi:hypothetical protein
MHEVILNNAPFQMDVDQLLERLRVPEGSRHAPQLRSFASHAQAIAKPKALYRAAFIDSKGEDVVQIEGVTLTSRVLRVNLESAHRVFVYVATCGTELDEWSKSVDGMLERYWADVMKEMALRSAMEALNEDIAQRYRPGHMAGMSPGELEDWPLEEQRALFALLGHTRQAIGVQLTDSLLMIPTKSVSGIRFPTEENFDSCLLCPRQNCPGRRAPYDEGLYERKYKADTRWLSEHNHAGL